MVFFLWVKMLTGAFLRMCGPLAVGVLVADTAAGVFAGEALMMEFLYGGPVAVPEAPGTFHPASGQGRSTKSQCRQ